MENNAASIKSINVNLLGFYTAILTTIVTAVTFGIAIFTPPLSGPFCAGSCIEYPYAGIISRFPRDYIWMYPAILLTLIYVVLMVCVYHYAAREKKVFGQMGLSFAIIAATILLIDYFIQVSVIQPSLLNGELDSIAMLTQYNPHGFFIALEEIGYLIMSISFLCITPVFSGINKLETAIRWTLVFSFVLTIISLVLISAIHGISREYRFEVAAITIDWIVLIILGILLSVKFKHAMRLPYE